MSLSVSHLKCSGKELQRVLEGVEEVGPKVGEVNSWPRQIYLSFWISLAFFTIATAIWLPGYLDDESPGSGYKLTDKSRPSLDESLVSSASTHFPVRPFLDEGPSSGGPVRESVPGTKPSGAPGGLPQRVVPGVNRDPVRPTQSNDRANVTKRAWVLQQATVFAAPRTTAQAIGTVERGTRVRWARQAAQGWEELIMRDGRSVYMQTGYLSFTSPQAQAAKFTRTDRSDEVDVGALPPAVDSFLANLGRGDVLRASTHLSPAAPTLEDNSLGALTPFLGASSPRVDRIETGRGRADRLVTVGDRNDPSIRVVTTWQWSSRQGRWLLLDWR